MTNLKRIDAALDQQGLRKNSKKLEKALDTLRAELAKLDPKTQKVIYKQLGVVHAELAEEIDWLGIQGARGTWY